MPSIYTQVQHFKCFPTVFAIPETLWALYVQATKVVNWVLGVKVTITHGRKETDLRKKKKKFAFIATNLQNRAGI